MLIFSKGHNSRKGDNSDKKEKYGSAMFPWGIHVWNFKTLICMVHKWDASDFVGIFSKRHNSRKGDNSDKKKACVKYFSMRNSYMKFQNPSMHGSWTDGRTDACMDGRTHNPKPICHVNFFEVRGITRTGMKHYTDSNSDQSLGSYMPLSGEKNDVSSFLSHLW